MEEKQRENFFYFILFLIVFFFTVGLLSVGSRYKYDVQKPVQLYFSGRYCVEGQDDWVTINKEEMKHLPRNKKITLMGHFDQQITEADQVFVYIYRIKMQLKKNGKIIVPNDGTSDDLSQQGLIGAQWRSLPIEGISRKDLIEIELEPLDENHFSIGYDMMMNRIYAGDYYNFMVCQLRQNAIRIFISIVIMIVAIVFFAAMQFLKYMKLPVTEGASSCAIVMLLGGICTFIDYRYVTLIFRNVFLVNTVDFAAQLLTCECLMIYLMSHLISKKFIKVTKCFIGIGGVVIFTCLWISIYGYTDQQVMLNRIIPLGVIFFSMILCFLTIDYHKYSDWKIRKVLVSSIILGLFCVVEMVHYYLANYYWILLFQIGLMIFTMMQMNILARYTKENFKKAKRADVLEKELIKNRIAIMMSQIQPHFLYNTLASIQELCISDGQKAYVMLSKFAQFLRGNMESLMTTELIPFEKELQHVKNYLYLEKTRYGDYLQVIYEIESYGFLLPALSVQPIVENAVHYGVGKKEEGGTITLSTFETDKEYRVMIEDDGVGMSKDQVEAILCRSNGTSHVGLDNVENRLKEQCGGYIEIESEIGVGTKVTIYIPKGGQRL